jgi:hypothetical protein
MSDSRIAFGASCIWWGGIADVGKRGKLPCCPVCRNMLFEMSDETKWWRWVDAHEAKGNPGYRKMIEWSRKRCFPSRGELEAAWEKAND